jgi:hypothetical protein
MRFKENKITFIMGHRNIFFGTGTSALDFMGPGIPVLALNLNSIPELLGFGSKNTAVLFSKLCSKK